MPRSRKWRSSGEKQRGVATIATASNARCVAAAAPTWYPPNEKPTAPTRAYSRRSCVANAATSSGSCPPQLNRPSDSPWPRTSTVTTSAISANCSANAWCSGLSRQVKRPGATSTTRRARLSTGLHRSRRVSASRTPSAVVNQSVRAFDGDVSPPRRSAWVEAGRSSGDAVTSRRAVFAEYDTGTSLKCWGARSVRDSHRRTAARVKHCFPVVGCEQKPEVYWCGQRLAEKLLIVR